MDGDKPTLRVIPPPCEPCRRASRAAVRLTCTACMHHFRMAPQPHPLRILHCALTCPCTTWFTATQHTAYSTLCTSLRHRSNDGGRRHVRVYPCSMGDAGSTGVSSPLRGAAPHARLHEQLAGQAEVLSCWEQHSCHAARPTPHRPPV